MYSKALYFSFKEGRSEAAVGFRLSNDLVAGAGGWTTVVAERGLDPLLGLPFGLNVGACGLGLNSLLLGFSLPPWALATPLERREKLGSMILDGPVGGSLASWTGIGFTGS